MAHNMIFEQVWRADWLQTATVHTEQETVMSLQCLCNTFLRFMLFLWSACGQARSLLHAAAFGSVHAGLDWVWTDWMALPRLLPPKGLGWNTGVHLTNLLEANEV